MLPAKSLPTNLSFSVRRRQRWRHFVFVPLSACFCPWAFPGAELSQTTAVPPERDCRDAARAKAL
jgi:hypothetical protein